MRILSGSSVFIVLLLAGCSSWGGLDGDPWPQYRGAFAAGVDDGHPLPASWDPETGDNIQWRTEIPGLAHSSPVVAGGRVYLTTAVGDGDAELRVGLYGSIAPVEDEGVQEFRVLCLDAASGELLWSRTAWRGEPAIKRHPKGSHAASTPATDGRRVVAFFGSEGLYCYDRDGELQWQRDFGVLDSGFFMATEAQWGFASSPVIHDDRVYLQVDVQGEDFVAALDLETGEDVWRTPRDDVPTWSTPAVYADPDRPQLVVNGYQHAGGYDLRTGEELWRTEAKVHGDIPVPTPVFDGDLVFLTSAHGRWSPIMAVSLTNAAGEFGLDAEGNANVAWSMDRGGNYMQTPLVYRGLLYACRDNSSLSCFDPKTGERLYRKRIEAGLGFTASPVAGDGKIYFSGEDGTIYVLAAGREFQRLAIIEMGEECMATPAISGGTLFLRSRRSLWAIREQGDPGAVTQVHAEG